jgi:phytoene dehydrogenase-like protein
MASYDVAVIGGGHNGLVAAAYLARTGLRVVVLERRERPGGPADTVEIAPGFRAPVAHTVGRFRASVIRDLGLEGHGLRLLRPGARAFLPTPDRHGITLWADANRTAEELQPRSPADALAWPRFDRKVRALASFVAYLHAMTPVDPSTTSLSDARGGLRALRALRRLGAAANRRETLRVLPMAVADFVSEHLQDDLLRAAVAARGVQYTAMGPWSAGTVAVLLSDSVGRGGAAGQATMAEGGSRALAEALSASARAAGAEVRLGTEVAAIITRRDQATGVALAGGEEVEARAVVSSADPKRTLLDLLDPEAAGPTLSWRASNLRSPGTVAKVDLALDGLPDFGVEPERLRGRIVMAAGIDPLEKAFDASKYGRISDEPYLESTIPSLSDPSLAPEGGHVMSVLAQWAPYRLADGGWDSRRDELGDLVLKRLEDVAPGIAGLVRERRILTPVDLERDYGLTEGHPLHLEPGLDQFFAWRPMLGLARYRTPIQGLYLCGSGSHPGGGITGAPGANAAREILSELRR